MRVRSDICILVGQSVLQDWLWGVPKPVRHLHGPALHPKGHLTKPIGYTYGLLLTGPKSQEYTDNRENARDSCITGGYGLRTDHRLVWLPKSYGPTGTLVGLMHAT